MLWKTTWSNPMQLTSEVRKMGQEAALANSFTQETYLVNGEQRKWQGEFSPVESHISSSESVQILGYVPTLGKEQALEAAHAASNAYAGGLGVWPQASVQERVAAVMKFAGMMQDMKEEVVGWIVKEIGKSQKDAETEFDRTVAYITDTCVALLEMSHEQGRPMTVGDVTASVQYEARGVVLCMGPFNYPLNETFQTLIPAILMGNTAIVKPARYGVLLFEPLQDAFQECFSPGVVNFVYGDGSEVIGPIMESGMIDSLAFIGSTQVADILIKQHPEPHRLHYVLGLATKNPALITETAEIEDTVAKTIPGSLSFNGQRCTSLALHLVADNIADEYAETFARGVEKLVLGNPEDPGVQITPLAEGPRKILYLQMLIDDAVSKGAYVINEDGGSVQGNLFTPAVLYPVTPEMKIYHEPQFGPIVPIARMSDVAVAVQEIAKSTFRQQVSIFSSDETQALSISNQLRRVVGRVNINQPCKRGPDELPFSAKGSSGIGTLSIKDALLSFGVQSVVARNP
ncbi:MAG: aldehyde dehydrogenase family protein [Bdellovibrionales bacterium]|nr:aldehyde dehydrogenase family protein [Bdellovibrionales bacterium]